MVDILLQRLQALCWLYVIPLSQMRHVRTPDDVSCILLITQLSSSMRDAFTCSSSHMGSELVAEKSLFESL